MTEYLVELSATAARTLAIARARLPTVLLVSAPLDNFLVSQTMTLKLEIKVIFITRLYGLS
jgi:hypothetical protein